MFRLVYIKLRNIYNLLSKHYASLIVDHTFGTICCYLLLMTCLSFGLFQAKLQADSQKLTYVQNSEALQDAKILSKFYPYRKDNFFTHKNIDFGYYIEIIVKIKNKNESFMNQIALDKFNQIYDNITQSLVVQVYNSDSNSTNNLTYLHNLCPKRLKICTIEGSVLRMKEFQEKLLQNKINYNKNDPTQLYTESNDQVTDGTSMNFVFGKNRKEECQQEFGQTKCKILSVNLFRARFELLSETDEDKTNAIEFMQVFVDYMDQTTKSDEYKLFDLAYHASHTVEKEIVKYSMFDFKYVLASFISIWIIYFFFMWFDLRMCEVYFKENFLNQAIGEKIMNQKKMGIFSKWLKINFNLVKTSGFLVFATFLQFFLTILATVGLMSLFSVPVNQLLYSTIFILMIINCHQSLMLFKNISDYKLKNMNQLKDKFDMINGSDKSFLDLNIKKKLTRTIQLILVPSFCTLTTSVGAYLAIALTAQFDAIRFFCYFLSKLFQLF